MLTMARGISEQLASNIEAWLNEDQVAAGTALPERALAERFRVSRSPIREALQILAQRHVIEPRAEGGYAVSERRVSAPQLALQPPEDEEELYLQIAKDHLEGHLPERLAENELMRRYEVTRVRLASALRRIAQEGWIERLPGNGWQFLPVLTSGAAYDQGYRMRILLEPAAITEPTWQLDQPGLLKCRAEQQALVDGAHEWASPVQIFDANSRLHETIAACSGNVFLADALRRVNRLRRLMEYQKAVDRSATARRSKEHLVLIDLLLNGQREAAADFMRLHLRDAAREKSASGNAGRPPPSAAANSDSIGLAALLSKG